jgi:glycosyltransferase involved in cell wall biosynthesis
VKENTMANTESRPPKKQPLVSVGIPTFNRPEGLSRVLQCIHKQTYRNIEVIVSDNCTPGETVSQLMNSMASNDDRFHYFRQDKNIGAIANFEFVLHKSSGKYFFWTADDDLCEENFIERIVTVLEENPDIALCTSDVKIIKEDDTLLSISKLDSIRISNNWKRARRFFFYYPTSNIFFCIYGIFRTDALKECGLKYASGWKGVAIYAEIVFLAAFSQWGRVVSIPEELKYFRHHHASETTSEHKKMSALDEFMLHLLNRLRLCKIAVASDNSWIDKFSLLWAVFISFLKNLKPPKFIVYSIPKPVRVWLKQNVFWFLR